MLKCKLGFILCNIYLENSSETFFLYIVHIIFEGLVRPHEVHWNLLSLVILGSIFEEVYEEQ